MKRSSPKSNSDRPKDLASTTSTPGFTLRSRSSPNSSVSTRDPWLPLPPRGGKGGKTETSLNYQAFKVYANLTPLERSIPRTVQILGSTRGPVEWLSRQFDWNRRASARDRRRAEIRAEERAAAVVAATLKEVGQWAGRRRECREKTWIQLRQRIERVKQLTTRPLRRVLTRQRVRPNVKDGGDSWEITSYINPALDVWHAVRAQTEMAKLYFCELHRTKGGPNGWTQNLANQVKLGGTRRVPLTPVEIRRSRDPWLLLPPKGGKGGKNETSKNYEAFEVFARLPVSERSSLRTAEILGKDPSLLERWSSLFHWVERAGAWDRSLAEIAEQEWTAAVVAATRKEDETWACRWVEFREELWNELRPLVQNLKQLLSMPIVRVQRRQRTKAKDGSDSKEITSVIHPALDGWRAVLAQTELAQQCFWEVKLTDGGSDGTLHSTAAEVKVGVTGPASLTPGTTPRPRDPWLPLPPKGGKGGKNETSKNYQAFNVFARLPVSERSSRRTAQILGKNPSQMERWSSLFHWVERAEARDCRLAETSEQEWNAAVVAANLKEDEKWACRWEEFHEDAWIQYSQLDDTLDALISKPFLRELTRQPAKPNAKEGPDSMETTWAINPALDMLRAGHAQFNLFKICFGNLKLTDA